MSEPMFTYNASALGLGGVLKYGDATTIIPSLASVALAPTGGEGSCEVFNYNENNISFGSARSYVRGTRSGQKYTTTSDIYITGLNLFGRVTADVLQSSVRSTRDVDEVADLEALSPEELVVLGNPDRTSFITHAMILGLRIDGVEVLPEFDSTLCLASNYTDFKALVGGANLPVYADRFGTTPQQLQNTIASGAHPIRATMLQSAEHGRSETIGRRTGYTLPVRGLGKVHLGELIVKPNRRRVNLLRLEFNSLQELLPSIPGLRSGGPGGGNGGGSGPDSGSMTILSEDSNGAPIWG